MCEIGRSAPVAHQLIQSSSVYRHKILTIDQHRAKAKIDSVLSISPAFTIELIQILGMTKSDSIDRYIVVTLFLMIVISLFLMLSHKPLVLRIKWL